MAGFRFGSILRLGARSGASLVTFDTDLFWGVMALIPVLLKIGINGKVAEWL